MATYYPCNQTATDLCNICNTTQSKGSCCTSSSSKNGSNQAMACSSYCDSGCNSKCNTAQTICKVHDQLISKHPDVSTYPGKAVAADDFIHLNWTPAFWNSLVKKVETAEKTGKLSSQGSGPDVTAKRAIGDPITADLYNQVRAKLIRFESASYPEVFKETSLIAATVANAMKTAYESAKFSSSVCDVCNAGDQSIRGGCNCNCSCSCDCSCGCSCTCSCACDAPCTCPSTPEPEPEPEEK